MKQVIFLSAILGACFFLSQSFLANNQHEEYSKQIEVSGVVLDGNNQTLSGVLVTEKNTTNYTKTNAKGEFKIQVQSESSVLRIQLKGFEILEQTVGTNRVFSITLIPQIELDEEQSEPKPVMDKVAKESRAYNQTSDGIIAAGSIRTEQKLVPNYPESNTESYDDFRDNAYTSSLKEPLSTLSIDVDRASYSNVRRFINQGQIPPQDAVRVEEMINYFEYNYEGPKKNADRPFSTHIDISQCPWNEDHQLMRVALQCERIKNEDIPPSNFVFLIDVSGSMNAANKLPLLKSAFKLLVDQLRPDDRVAITVYAGAAGTVLESTPGTDKTKILEAIDKLSSGGSTAGAAGIQLAYQIAEKNFIKEGNNRIILATDGDFNVGVNGDDELIRLIEQKRDKGVFLSVIGFGQGNYKDSKMQKIADHGNGNHSYIDNMSEAKKVLMDEFGSTLYTIAKDVKIQIEFNPAVIGSYRLVGYENRVLAAEDFNDDKKDAGEMGAGHTVTVLYELIPVGVNSKYTKEIDDLKYQETKDFSSYGNEIGTIKYRFKKPDADRSTKTEEIIKNTQVAMSDDFAWAASVAEFGLLLRNSPYKETASYDRVIQETKRLTKNSNDVYRNEFIQLVEIAKSLTNHNVSVVE